MSPPNQPMRHPNGSRSRSGCITCRIRKKKCDEKRPVCEACWSRQLACYGFNTPLPLWFTNKATWEEVRNSDEAKNLRSLAETRYKISRKVGSKESTATSITLAQDATDSRRSYSPVQLRAQLPPDDVCISSSYVFSKAGVNIWQQRPESLWWDNKMRSLVPNSGSVSHEEMRLLMLYLDVIHPITHTFYKIGSNADRSWMLDRLVRKRSLYCSALSISACFDHSLTQPPSINDIGICSKVRNLQNRAIYDLRTELDEFASMSNMPSDDFVWAGVQLLDVITHLETLEIFSMLGGNWEMHHRAARKVVSHLEVCTAARRRKVQSKTSIIEATLADLPKCDARRRSLAFSLNNFIWIDVLATSTFGAFCYESCAFDYLPLLEAEIIKPEEIMGCQGWIIATIVRIVRLEQWKMMHENLLQTIDLNSKLSQQGKQIADELKSGVKRLEEDLEYTNTITPQEDIRLISIIWAYAARVLLQVVVLDTDSFEPTIDQTFVNICLQKLEALPTRLRMRTSWPYTIAGSMATSEEQQARFRWVFGKIMQEAQPPGISWKGLIVMEESWKLRRFHASRKVGWREAMESLGVRVILT